MKAGRSKFMGFILKIIPQIHLLFQIDFEIAGF